jgi:hypothetical protein
MSGSTDQLRVLARAGKWLRKKGSNSIESDSQIISKISLLVDINFLMLSFFLIQGGVGRGHTRPSGNSMVLQ